MDLQSLLAESRANSTLATIEATVATGLEPVAMEECREKLKTTSIILARGRLFFNTPITMMNVVEELRSIDNLYVIMKMVSNLDFTDHIDQDMSILKSQVEKYDVTKALVIWRERRKFRGVLYPTEEGYRIAKDTESEMKKLARTMAESHIKSKKCEAVETDENELHLLSVNSQYERTSFNAAEHEAYRKIDSRLPENKVLKYRVTCIRNGSHSFGSQDAAYHIGGTLQDMFHWIVDLALYDLEVVVNIREATMYYGLALTEESKHHRNIHFFGPTTLRATICYNLLHIAQPKAGDIVVDPMCGGGSIPIEGSLSFKNCYYTCGDVHEKAVNRILLNLEYLQSHRRNYVDAYWWDITCLPLQDSSVDIFITDLPFGKRSGSVFDNRMLYKKALVEMARATRCNTGRAVLLTHDRKSMTMALSFNAAYWKLAKKLKTNIGGLEATVYVLWRLKAPVTEVTTPYQARKKLMKMQNRV